MARRKKGSRRNVGQTVLTILGLLVALSMVLAGVLEAPRRRETPTPTLRSGQAPTLRSGQAPTVTPALPTATPEPPTATPEPPTATPEPPTATPTSSGPLPSPAPRPEPSPSKEALSGPSRPATGLT